MASCEFKCPICGTPMNYDAHTFQCVCTNCGYVERPLAYGLEHRIFEAEDERLKRGDTPIEPLLRETALAPGVLGRREKEIRTSEERHMEHAVNAIRHYAALLNLPDVVIAEAKKQYRRLIRAGLTRGRNIRALAALALYVAARNTGNFRAMAEFTRILDPEARKSFLTTRSQILKFLRPKPFTISVVLDRVLSLLGAPGVAALKAREALKKIQSEPALSGKNPLVTAVALGAYGFAAAGLPVPWKKVGEVASLFDVKLSTVRSRMQEIERVVQGLEA